MQKAAHTLQRTDRDELNAVFVGERLDFLTGFEAEALPDVPRDDDLKFGRNRDNVHGASIDWRIVQRYINLPHPRHTGRGRLPCNAQAHLQRHTFGHTSCDVARHEPLTKLLSELVANENLTPYPLAGLVRGLKGNQGDVVGHFRGVTRVGHAADRDGVGHYGAGGIHQNSYQSACAAHRRWWRQWRREESAWPWRYHAIR